MIGVRRGTPSGFGTRVSCPCGSGGWVFCCGADAEGSGCLAQQGSGAASLPLAIPGQQQRTQTMEVGCQDPQGHRSGKALPSVRPDPVQTMAFQMVDRRFHRRMLLAGL